MKQKLIEYIQKTHKNIPKLKETSFYNDIPVFIKDPFSENISLEKVLHFIEKTIPKHLVYNVDTVYIGQFKIFREKEVNAAYEDGVLYVSNEQDDENDLVDDIVHELAHATEEKYSLEIYGDEKVEKEFLAKRLRLYEVLKSYDYSVFADDFTEIRYSEKFDNFLYKEIGYEKLEHFSIGLFLNNYSITSLKEYYATGFEYYFLQNAADVASVCPDLYNKIELLESLEEI